MNFNQVVSKAYNDPSVVGFLINLCGEDWEDIRQATFEKILAYEDSVMAAYNEGKVNHLIITACRNYFYDVKKVKKNVKLIPITDKVKHNEPYEILNYADRIDNKKNINIDNAINTLFSDTKLDLERIKVICDGLKPKQKKLLVKAANELKNQKHPDHFKGLMIKSILTAGEMIIHKSKKGRPENAETLLSRNTGISIKEIKIIKNEYFNLSGF